MVVDVVDVVGGRVVVVERGGRGRVVLVDVGRTVGVGLVLVVEVLVVEAFVGGTVLLVLVVVGGGRGSVDDVLVVVTVDVDGSRVVLVVVSSTSVVVVVSSTCPRQGTVATRTRKTETGRRIGANRWPA